MEPDPIPRAIRDRMQSTLVDWIPRGADVAIVDVPVNRNPGDLFILAVTRQLLADFACRVVYQAGVRDYASAVARRQVGADAIVVGLGGGNFGDEYPRYQALRERVVADFRQNRIVILPQSIHFRQQREADRALSSLARHPDLRIAVRDRRSLDAVRRVTPHVQLFPDIVHAFGTSRDRRRPIDGAGSRTAPAGRTLYLLRRDRERAARQPGGAVENVHSVDWPAVFPDLAWRLAITAALMPVAPGRAREALHRGWSAYAGRLLDRGTAYVQPANAVVTDRLHGAILARLAGRPVTLLDNSYGKLAAYYETWWADDPEVDLAS